MMSIISLWATVHLKQTNKHGTQRGRVVCFN